MVQVTEQIFVPAPAEAVWRVLSDPKEVSECIPGATLEQAGEDGELTGAMAAKFGPLRVAFTCVGNLAIDTGALTGVLNAHGRDGHGGVRFRLEARYRVEQVDGGSRVALEAAVDLSGRLASVVESGAGVVVRQMTAEFGERLAGRTSGSGSTAPERGVASVERRTLARRVADFVRRLRRTH